MLKKATKYFTIGILNGGIFYLLLWFFTEIVGIWYMWSAILTLCITVIGTFAFNSIWTWRHKRVGAKSAMNIYRFLKFIVVGSVTAVIGLLSLFLVTEYFGIHYTITYIIMSIIVLIVNFTLHNNWTWGETESKELDFIIEILRRTKMLILIKKLGVQI